MDDPTPLSFITQLASADFFLFKIRSVAVVNSLFDLFVFFKSAATITYLRREGKFVLYY